MKEDDARAKAIRAVYMAFKKKVLDEKDIPDIKNQTVKDEHDNKSKQ